MLVISKLKLILDDEDNVCYLYLFKLAIAFYHIDNLIDHKQLTFKAVAVHISW